MNIKLIDNWKKAYKMVSVQAMSLALALQGAWLALPANLIDKVPTDIFQGITVGLLVLGVLGRLVTQDSIKV